MKFEQITLLIALILSLFSPAIAKQQTSNIGKNLLGPGADEKLPPGMVQSGQLFTVKIVPLEKEAHIYVVGKENVKLDWSGTDIEATISFGSEEKKLTLYKGKDYFVVKQPLKGGLNLKLQSKPMKNIEKFHFKLD